MTKSGPIYREIQLLCQLYNFNFKQTVIFGYVTVAPTSLSVCLYLLISRWSLDLDATSFLVFLNLSLFCASIILFVFHYAVKVYSTSSHMKASNYLVNLGRLKKTHSVKIETRYFRSLTALKIRFFFSNYFEAKTPLVILDLSVIAAINLALV